MTRYEECLSFVLKREGGYCDDPLDHGGATNFGITQRVYDQFRASCNLPDSPVRHISPFEVKTIYNASYWSSARCDELTPPIDIVVFDGAVNHGASRMVKMLQSVVGVDADGEFGPVTLAAVKEQSKGYMNATVLADRLIAYREGFYHRIVERDASQGRFLNGWINRMSALRQAIRLA